MRWIVIYLISTSTSTSTWTTLYIPCSDKKLKYLTNEWNNHLHHGYNIHGKPYYVQCMKSYWVSGYFILNKPCKRELQKYVYLMNNPLGRSTFHINYLLRPWVPQLLYIFIFFADAKDGAFWRMIISFISGHFNWLMPMH